MVYMNDAQQFWKNVQLEKVRALVPILESEVNALRRAVEA
jgi:hypothetical protein